MATITERGGVSRVLRKIEVSVNAGNYYEAHQMYRTLYFRYLNQKKYEDLLQMLHDGASLLLQRDQQGSGADLAILLIEVLTKSETKPNEEWIVKIAKLFELIGSGIPERDTFLTNSIKWSMDSNKKGHPLLHKRIAEIYWKEKDYTASQKHFLHSNDGVAYAEMLVDMHTTQGLKTEVDLCISQAVLRILCLRNKQMATDTFNNYVRLHPDIRSDTEPPYCFPLLNFFWFLMHAIENGYVNQFNTLRKWYEKSLMRDQNYSNYLDKIGRIWFDQEVPQNCRNSNTMFSGLLKTLIGETESSDDEVVGDNEVASDLIPDLD